MISSTPVPDNISLTLPNTTESGRYSFEVVRQAPGGDRIELYSSPVWYEAGPAFELGKVKLNKKKGTAKLKVNGLRTTGQLSLSGKGLKKPHKAAGPGSAKLKVKPKGKLKRKLAKKGKAKVKLQVTFAPDGGDPAQVKDKVKLKRKRKHG